MSQWLHHIPQHSVHREDLKQCVLYSPSIIQFLPLFAEHLPNIRDTVFFLQEKNFLYLNTGRVMQNQHSWAAVKRTLKLRRYKKLSIIHWSYLSLVHFTTILKCQPSQQVEGSIKAWRNTSTRVDIQYFHSNTSSRFKCDFLLNLNFLNKKYCCFRGKKDANLNSKNKMKKRTSTKHSKMELTLLLKGARLFNSISCQKINTPYTGLCYK